MSTDRSESAKIVKVAIAGLGRVGATFLERLTQNTEFGIEIVATADTSTDAPGRAFASKNGIPVFDETKNIVAMGDGVDLIFDLTGSSSARSTLRRELARSGNQHTVLAPEVVAFLMWNMMSKGESFPDHHAGNEGY